MELRFDYSLAIYDDLVSGLEDHEVEEVRVGLHGVYVQSRTSGISLRYDGKGQSSIKDSGSLTRKTALNLSEYLRSWDFAEASIGLAALNSLIEGEGKTMNAFDFADKNISEGNNVAVIGYFPWIERARTEADIWVLERKPGEKVFPDTAVEYILPKCDFVLVTGSSLVNKTLPRILELSQNAFTIVLGPSTPLSPVLFKYGADAIAGARVRNGVKVRRMIEEGSRICDLKNELEFLMRFNPESEMP